MARERYLVHVREEDLQPSEPIGQPQTIKGKWENFWFHYKLPTVIVSFLVIVSAILVFQLVTKEKYDYTVTVVTQKAISPTAFGLMEAQLLPFAQDLDGNGEKSVLINNVALQTSVGNDPYAGVQKLMTIIGAGDYMLFAVESDIYEARLKDVLEADGAFFRTIVTPDGEKIERWTWNASTAIGTAESMTVYFAEDMVWFVRAATGAAAGEKNEKISDDHLALLESYMAAHAAYHAQTP